MIEPNTLSDGDLHPEVSSKSVRTPMADSAELTHLTEKLRSIHGGILNDAPLTNSHISDVQASLGSTPVTIDGKTLTLDSDEFRTNATIWKEILDGNVDRQSELTLLPLEVAAALADTDEITIDLPLITQVSDEVIEALTRDSRYKFIKLDGMRRISAKQFVALRKGNRGLQMNGLSSLPPFSEEDHETLTHAALSGRRALKLSGIHSLTSLELQIILDSTGGDLELNGLHGLPELTAGIERGLATHSHELSLNGLPSVTDEEFRKLLSKRAGAIHMNGIKELPPLSKETGFALMGRELGTISLGLETISDTEFRILQKCRKNTLVLKLLKTLPDFSEQTIQSLKLHAGGFDFSGLSTITDRQMQGVLGNGQFVFLDGLSALPEFSEKTAKAFHRHGYYGLTLRQLTSISEHNARIFAVRMKRNPNPLQVPKDIQKKIEKYYE